MKFLETLTNLLVSYGPFGLLLLAFLDSAGIPLSAGMDAIVILVAAKTPSHAWLGAGLAVLGSMMGNTLLFLASRHGSRWVRKEREIVTPGSPSRLRVWFNRYGLMTIFVPALVPIIPLPLKAFVICAGTMRMKLPPFLAVILVARVIRYFGEAYLGVKIGHRSMEFLRHHVWTMLAIAVGFCVLVFGVARFRDSRRRAQGI